MSQYFDKVIRGTEREDALVINQFIKNMVGKRFTFLNYYKEIPVSYDATLLSIENEMAEFEVHEYQAKAINIERRALIYSHELNPIKEDLVSEAFYVNVAKKRVVLCKFGYAKIRSDMRRFVRVTLDRNVKVEIALESDIVKGIVKDISLGGAAIGLASSDLLAPGQQINLFLKLPDLASSTIAEVAMAATIVSLAGDEAPYKCNLEFHPEKHSQQQIAYFINSRQVEIIKELKEIKE